MSIPIILDCDPGNGVPGANVDDALALLYALRSPNIDLRAVWSVFGNTPAPVGYQCALDLIHVALPSSIPSPAVRCGALTPLEADTQRWDRQRWEYAHSPAGIAAWGEAPASANSHEASQATRRGDDTPVPAPLSLLVDDLRASGPITVVATGPLTTIARLLREKPECARSIERIVLMGGCFGYGDLVDTNFAVDPLAARIVIHSGIPLTVVPLDTTRTTQLSAHRWAKLLETKRAPAAYPHGSAPLVEALHRWIDPWLSFSAATRPVDGMWVHDLVTLITLTHPQAVSVTRERVDVDANGKLIHSEQGTPVEVVSAVDNEAMLKALEEVL